MSSRALPIGDYGAPETTPRPLRAERFFIALAAAIYLWLFATVIPSGDGQVYARHIDAGEWVWNPNHLLMDPVGMVWLLALRVIDPDFPALTGLKLISGITTVLSLLLFHRVLVESGIRSGMVRLLCVLGLFASRNFLTMAVSEEIFMLQMPLLMFALLQLSKILTRPNQARMRSAIMLGSALGLATAVTIHNAFLCAAIVLFLLASADSFKAGVHRALPVAAAAAGVAAPLFLLAYLFASPGTGFVEWMLAYQGSEENPSAALYGLSLTLDDVLSSLARLVLNTFTNLLSVGYLGTVLKSVVFGAPLEIKVNVAQVALGSGLLVTIMAICAVLIAWVFRRWRTDALVRVSLAWMAGYYAFNFYWNDSSDQFWFQNLPVVWLLFALFVREEPAGRTSGQRKSLLIVTVPILLVLNTSQEIAPLRFQDVDRYMSDHRALFRPGDLELIPGWDDARWIALDERDTQVKQINLMNAAMRPANDAEHISKLRELVQARLAAGHRVFVARLYDRDHDPKPWDQLRKLGWPRERLQQELASFESRKAAVIGGIVIRELRIPEAGQ